MQVRRFYAPQLYITTLAIGVLVTPAAAEASTPPVGRIIGGEETIECGWPSTTYIGGCTGSLIHPRVMMSATHCGGGSKNVTFGDTQGGEFSVGAQCTTSNDGSDWMYCILEEEVTNVPIVPPIHGCEVDILKDMIGEDVVVAGFGVENWPNGQGGEHKKQLTLQLEAVGREIQVSGTQSEGLCHGDSGGPVFVRLKNMDGSDGGWRMAGQTHGPGSDGAECAGNTAYSNVWDAIAVLEESEGIDVTPCTDADGSWNPGPDCKDFPANPGEAGGSWPNCTAPQTVMPATCGANPNGGDDDDDDTTSGEDSSSSDDDDDDTSSSDDDDDDSSSSDDDDDDDDASDDDDDDTSASDDDDDDSDDDDDDDDTSSEEESGESSDDDDDDDGDDDDDDDSETTDDDDDDDGSEDGSSGGCNVLSTREPASWLLFGLGALGLSSIRRRRSSSCKL